MWAYPRYLPRYLPCNKLDVLASPERAQEESPSIFPKLRKAGHLLETTLPSEDIQLFPKLLLPLRTLNCSRDHSFRGHLRLENSQAPDRPKVHSFPETSVLSEIATTAVLLDLRLQVATATHLGFRLQLHSLTCPTFVTSWAIMGWAGFLKKSQQLRTHNRSCYNNFAHEDRDSYANLASVPSASYK